MLYVLLAFKIPITSLYSENALRVYVLTSGILDVKRWLIRTHTIIANIAVFVGLGGGEVVVIIQGLGACHVPKHGSD